jgi:hypothetical protein
MSIIDQWRGGRLRVFFPMGLVRAEVPSLERDYVPIGEGWAMPAERPIRYTVPELDGVTLDFDLRGGRLRCVGVHAESGVTPGLLRRVAATLRDASQEVFVREVVRLIEVDGEVAGEVPQAQPTNDRRMAHFGQVAEDAIAAAERTVKRAGRPPLPEAHLDRVAELHRKAELLGLPRADLISKEFPGYSAETIRNWVRLARRAGKIPPVKSKGES